MLRELDYQKRVLELLDSYLDVLGEEKAKADKVADLVAQQPDLGIQIPDYAQRTWQRMGADGKLPPSRSGIPFSSRTDGAGRPVPNAVLKVPTGGGKTFLAVNAVSRIFGRFLSCNTGFVLWIVPNEAIYSQTLKRLKDRQDPYRQALDRAAAGRVKIMEKTDRLDARDVQGQLCVMLLMLQSANRETKDTLKMFQDRGDVAGFSPPEGDQKAHGDLIKAVGNLDCYDDLFPMVKDSLGNALRIIRPVVVLDEGHRAVSDLAFETLYGFNPRFVLELTATPHDVQPRGGNNPREARYANVLVEVTGTELDREGMIKMPLNLDARQGTDWKATLNAAVVQLASLDALASKFRADTGRYIRPIMLVQVERTGKDQRAAGLIHADDAKDWLLAAGFDENEIAIKTAETNDLSQPENQDLLSPTNRIRAIITKSALQEGWDCPFAYVLCSLAASSNLSAMTQLVGRILRQPDALKTGVAALDECHVVTHHAGTGDVVNAIKKGLEGDGLGDLVLRVVQADATTKVKGSKTISRRADFASTEIYLPLVLHVDGETVRPLDYETDILAAIAWQHFDPVDIAAGIPLNAQRPEGQIQRISLTDAEEHFKAEQIAAAGESLVFDPSYAVRMVSDIVPNPFLAREIVGKLINSLLARGFTMEKIGALAGLVVDELRRKLDLARNGLAEGVFREKVKAGSIQFRLRLDDKNWRMPFSFEVAEPERPQHLLNKDGAALERSLFMPVFANELNNDEQDVAVYLDGDKALKWWHRNVARTQYGLQGWKRAKVYPDFVFAANRGSGGGARITVLETKGDQLDNLDTAYKRDLMKLLSENFAWDATVPAGQLQLVQADGTTVECSLILMSEWREKLPQKLDR
jgi:type III restriction enzyme